MIELATSLPGAGPVWLQWAVAIVGATGIGSVLVVIAKGKVQRRNLDAKADHTHAEADSIEADSLRDSIKALRERCNETDDQNTKMRANIVDLRVKVDECEEDRRELHRLHSANAKDLALALTRITKLETTLAVYERRLTQAGLKTTMEGT